MDVKLLNKMTVLMSVDRQIGGADVARKFIILYPRVFQIHHNVSTSLSSNHNLALDMYLSSKQYLCRHQKLIDS